MIKAKVHAVLIGNRIHLVMALTKEGAVRDVCAHIVSQMRATAHVDLATPEQIYAAGVEGAGIINGDHFKNTDDPNQLPLDGITINGP